MRSNFFRSFSGVTYVDVALFYTVIFALILVNNNE